MRLLIADEHVLFRRSLKVLLETKGHEVVAEVGTGLEAVAMARKYHPDVVLMDLEMPELGGLGAMRRMLEDQPEVRVVILTGVEDDAKLVRALEAGARGYVHKSVRPSRFFDLLEGLLRGEPALSPGLAHGALLRLAASGRARPAAGRSEASAGGGPRAGELHLTRREREVLELMAGGSSSTRDLALHLGVGERTVKFHVGNLLQKLQVKSRAEAVSYALRRRLVVP